MRRRAPLQLQRLSALEAAGGGRAFLAPGSISQLEYNYNFGDN